MPRNSTGYFSQEKSGNFLIKWLSKPRHILLIIVSLLLVSAIVLSPRIFIKKSPQYTENYKLQNGFTRANIETVVAIMHEDTEYVMYFNMLGPDSISRATDAAYRLLDKSRDQQKLLKVVIDLQRRIQSSANDFNNLQFPREFFNNPGDYPALIKILWGFIETEFQLAILGVCYKSTYDPDFQFHWDEAAKQSGLKAIGTIFTLTFKQRQEIEYNLAKDQKNILTVGD